jgi:hypothetical protein
MQKPYTMISQKTLRNFLKGAIAVMPAIPYITKRRNSSILSYVLGGVGVAIVGGLAGIMFMSPRTRYRALDVAKQTYGKVNHKIEEMKNQGATAQRPANGLASDQAGGYTTGL